MALISETALSILTALGVIAKNLTSYQLKLLEWRLSDEGKQYYTDKENKLFYKALSKGNTDVIDAIRFEKQKRINIAILKKRKS